MIRNIERDYRIIYTCTNPPPRVQAEMAKKHLAEGVARRFIMIGDSLEAIDRIAAANRTRVLNPDEAAELNLHTNSYYVHLRGTLDNLAWALHYEYGILGGGAARKVDQYAARKVIHSEGGSFYVLLISYQEESACGNVGISGSVRDFQAPVGIVL